MTSEYPAAISVPTSEARERLSGLITHVQDPRAFAVLTRHGRPVAALVSMAELKRIWKQHDITEMLESGQRRAGFYLGPSGKARTLREAAEEVQKIQLDRKQERELLDMAGLDPVTGGEILAEVPGHGRARRWWWPTGWLTRR